MLSAQSSLGLQNQVITKTDHTLLTTGFGNNVSSDVPKSSMNYLGFPNFFILEGKLRRCFIFQVMALFVMNGLFLCVCVCVYRYVYSCMCISKNTTLRVCLLEILMTKINRKMCKNVSMCDPSIGNIF